MTNPLVSILVANYNNAQYIEESLNSVLSQTYTNTEIIIVDDNSEDSSIDVISKFIDEHSNIPIHFVQNTDHQGCGRIKRQCIELSHGDYFAFLDPDDTITNDAVQKLLDLHQQGDYSIVYSTHYICDESLNVKYLSTYVGAIPQGESNLTSPKGNVSAFALCKRSCYDMTTGINSSYIVAEDQDLYYKMEEVAPLCFLDEPLYFYRKHNHNMSFSSERELRNKYWNYECRKAAYIRRKKDRKDVPNLTCIQVYIIKCYYYFELALYKKHNGKCWWYLLLLTLPMWFVSPRKYARNMHKLF